MRAIVPRPARNQRGLPSRGGLLEPCVGGFDDRRRGNDQGSSGSSREPRGDAAQPAEDDRSQPKLKALGHRAIVAGPPRGEEGGTIVPTPFGINSTARNRKWRIAGPLSAEGRLLG